MDRLLHCGHLQESHLPVFPETRDNKKGENLSCASISLEYAMSFETRENIHETIKNSAVGQYHILDY